MYVAAIDTGGTKITGAAVDEYGRIFNQIRIENTGRSGEFVIETYCRIYESLSKKYKLCAISVGAGGRIERKSGIVKSAIPIYENYVGLNIRKKLEDVVHLPVFVDNDCSMALRGELWKGNLSEYQKVASLILGTGVGGAVATRVAAEQWEIIPTELGHYILYPGGKKCLCGQNGCVEKYLSGTALWQNYNQLIQAEKIASGYEFFERLSQGDSTAMVVLNAFKKDLATCIISIQNLFETDAILIGGGVADTKQYWWDDMLEIYLEKVNKSLPKMKILCAANGNQAALLGAAKLAFEKLQEGCR